MKERIISSIIMAIIFVPILLIGNIPFEILIGVITNIAIFEILKFKNYSKLIKSLGHIEGTLILLSNMLKFSKLDMITAFILLNFSLIVFINDKDKYNYNDAIYLLITSILIGICFNKILLFRNRSLYIIIYLFLTTIITDVFSLFSGKCFGKHKLSPKISPNKTIEGLVGGTLFGVTISSIFYIFFISNSNILLTVLITLLLSLIGSMGDLIMSSIKRYEGIKDFGNLIPGHGGILDRFDSIMFVVLLYSLIINYI